MGFILNRDDAFNHLIRMTRYDYSTAVHSVNVGIFSMGLARAMFGDSGLHDMKELAAAFFLHDIGISTVPRDILHKSGPLTHDEWYKIKQHPFQGYKLLKRFNVLTEEARTVVMEHHERHNGKGYPKGISGDSIHVYSKICIIADVFDALTSPRPYRQFQSSFQALKTMQAEMNLDFDPEIFKRFVMLFSGVSGLSNTHATKKSMTG
jgi:HD-GYP domain-containing protein (c-di-GMP phosphodiesterase class II)